MNSLLLILACAPPPTELDLTESCDPRILEAGEVRVRQVGCSDELEGSGEARTGDWLIENQHVRAFVRAEQSALTRLDGAGGTLLDLVAVGQSDVIVEAVPLVGEQWFDVATVMPGASDSAAWLDVEGTLRDGSQSQIRWHLDAGSVGLEVSGADAIEVVPRSGAELVGDTLERTVILGTDGVSEDLGGWVRLDEASALWVGSRATVYEQMWPSGLDVSGEAVDATWVHARIGDATVARLVVSEGQFSGRVPSETEFLVAVADGWADGSPVPPAEDVTLELGGAGSIWVRVQAEDGTPLPATLMWKDETWPVVATGEEIPVGPGTDTARLMAGPRYEVATFDDLVVDGDVHLDVVLREAIEPMLLAQIGLPAWPDKSERRAPEVLVENAVAAGIGFLVLTAADEVADPDPGDIHLRRWIEVQGGSQADAELGRPIAWPWSDNARHPGHGAAPWRGLNAQDLLALMERNNQRHTVVDTDWVAEAGDPAEWDPVPSLFALASFSDVDVYRELLDGWRFVPPVGPLTWVMGVDLSAYSEVDVETFLMQGHSVATNGPFVALSVNGAGPGELVSNARVMPVRIEVHAPEWIPLSGVALWGSGGQLLGSWPITSHSSPRAVIQTSVTDVDWVLATTWGEQDNPPLMLESAWAMTAPVFVDRGSGWIPPGDLRPF